MQIVESWLTDAATIRVIETLTATGAQVFFVGGCVRNALIGAPVSDIDIATDALPHRVLSLAREAGIRSIPTGLDHGTVTLVSGGATYEVTTFRKDVATDGRRATVAFSTRIEDDAKRRDFTMNALYADASGQVVDPLGGLPDLLARKVRFIDDAAQRIAEDYLRILRFFRFHAWYGDPDRGLDTEGLAACAAAVNGLDQLSKERVGAEVRKLLLAPNPVQSLVAMDQSGVLARVLSDATSADIGDIYALETRYGLAIDWRRRLVGLGVKQASAELRLSKKDARYVEKLTEYGQTDLALAAVAYFEDEATAIDVAVLRAVWCGAVLDQQVFLDITRGAEANFPVRAVDLMPKYSSKELGVILKALENKWIESDFVLSRESLIHGV